MRVISIEARALRGCGGEVETRIRYTIRPPPLLLAHHHRYWVHVDDTTLFTIH